MAGEAPKPRVTFAKRGLTVEWDGAFANLLAFVEAQGLKPPYSCRVGVCNGCMRDISGEVTYVSKPLRYPPGGCALICCSVPKGDITLDL